MTAAIRVLTMPAVKVSSLWGHPHLTLTAGDSAAGNGVKGGANEVQQTQKTNTTILIFVIPITSWYSIGYFGF